MCFFLENNIDPAEIGVISGRGRGRGQVDEQPFMVAFFEETEVSDVMGDVINGVTV